MAWVEVMPDYQSLFCVWNSAAEFLSWTGILVNQHRKRQVEEVALPECDRRPGQFRLFLKKEFGVSWHDRFRNAWHGFGWCATSVREAAVLIAAKRAGVACPDVVAFGEHERAAFVVLRGEIESVELREWLASKHTDTERVALAERLGQQLARLHNAGFEHPDLFAKHILVDPNARRLCFLDWARARKRRVILWQTRARDLAVLEATLHATLASTPLRCRFLQSYLRNARCDVPPLGQAAREIEQRAETLRKKRGIREIGQRATPPRDQQFVPLCNGKLLLVRSYFDELDGASVELWQRFSESEGSELPQIVGTADAASMLLVQRWARQSGRREMPTLAHTLFHLQRFEAPTPRLLAVAYSATHQFAVVQQPRTTHFAEAFAKATHSRRREILEHAGRIVRAVHEAGFRLQVNEKWPRVLGVIRDTGAIVIVQVDAIERAGVSWRDLAPAELSNFGCRLTGDEQRIFLLSYLGKDAAPAQLESFEPASAMERLRPA